MISQIGKQFKEMAGLKHSFSFLKATKLVMLHESKIVQTQKVIC
jgi:hypothetical protein